MRIAHQCPVVGRSLLQLIRLTARKTLVSNHYPRCQKVDVLRHRIAKRLFVVRKMGKPVTNILHQILSFVLWFRDHAGHIPCFYGEGYARFEFCRCHNLFEILLILYLGHERNIQVSTSDELSQKGPRYKGRGKSIQGARVSDEPTRRSMLSYLAY